MVVVSLSHVRNAENECEKHAKGSNNNVAHCQEVVLPSEGIGSREDEIFLSLEWGDLELVFNMDLIFSCFQILGDSSPKFTEVWKTSCSHPDNEVLY